MCGNGFAYDLWRVPARNLANKKRMENPRGFSEAGKPSHKLYALLCFLPTHNSGGPIGFFAVEFSVQN